MFKTSNWRGTAENVLLAVINVTAALVISALVVLLVGHSPLEAIQYLLTGAFGSKEGIGFTLYYATSFTLTGLAVSVALHAGLFTIGAEGQAYIGGLGIALVCLTLDSYVPWWITIVPALLAGSLFGMAWASIPAYLQAKRGSHLVITTIMFNLLASSVMVYLIVNVLREPGSMSAQTRLFHPGGLVPKLGEVLPFDFGTSPVNITLLLALFMAVAMWVFIYKTKLGYEFRAFGANPAAAENAGISQMKITMLAMCISGAIAGMVGINIVMGELGKLVVEFPAHTGLVGLAVALMGRSHPLGIILPALLFGALYQGGAEVAFWMPGITKDMIVLIQGLVIFFAGALALMFQPAVRRLLRPGNPA